MIRLLSLMMGILVIVGLSACDNTKNRQSFKTASVDSVGQYSGHFRLAADESLRNILEQELEIFEYLYPEVKVDVRYLPEPEILNSFRENNTDEMLLARLLTENELETFKVNDTLYVREFPVGYDAVAMIANNKFNEELTLDKLKSYFVSDKESKHLIFEGKTGTSLKVVLDVLGLKNSISNNVFGADSLQEVIDYLENDETAIGFIPYNVIADRDSRIVMDILEQVKVLGLSIEANGSGRRIVTANQSDIYTKDYPFLRSITAVTKYSYDDNVELLFANFLTKQKAAKILLKGGLIPATMPQREINVNTD